MVAFVDSGVNDENAGIAFVTVYTATVLQRWQRVASCHVLAYMLHILSAELSSQILHYDMVGLLLVVILIYISACHIQHLR